MCVRKEHIENPNMQAAKLVLCFAIVIVFSVQTQCEKSCAPSLEFTSQSGALFVNNKPFYLKGASWFGYETSINVFHGLWNEDYRDLLGFLANNGFNAMRVPMYLDMILHDATPNGIVYYNHNGSRMNLPLENKSSLQVLDVIIQAAADLGILVMIDLHSFEPDAYASNGLWYDATHPESLVLQGWDIIIKRYANQWNVFAIDLKNEPFQTTWNTGNLATDWNSAAERIGNHVLQNGGERFLIFVEGTAGSPPCTENCFYGENLQGVKTSPVKLANQKRLVYSPHVYGPSVYDQPYFKDPTYPKNLPPVSYMTNITGNAIVVGEWGGLLGGASEVWLNAFVDWLIKNKATNQFFWCLNPNSADTGGLLEEDWMTPVIPKLNLLQKLVPNPTKITSTSGDLFCVENN